MNSLLSVSGWIDRINTRVGQGVYWLVLVVSLISAANAVMRFTINYSSNGFLEIQWYLFSAIFLLGAGYTLQKNEHVRIDIVSGRLSPRARAWIDIFGIVFFLLPMAALFVDLGWPFFMTAFSGGEMSSNAGGLIRWPAKLLVPVGFVLLGLQGLSELIKRFAFLGGRIPDPNERAGRSAEEELADEISATARGIEQ